MSTWLLACLYVWLLELSRNVYKGCVESVFDLFNHIIILDESKLHVSTIYIAAYCKEV